MSDLDIRIRSLHLYPVKSCAGLAVDEALLVETGFDLDRAWMVVDPDGSFVSQRELPRMALVRPQFKGGDLVLRAPGMLALHLRVDTVEDVTRVRVWDDTLPAYDMGALAAQWFSDFLGRSLRLARFDPAHKRVSNRRWTGAVEALNAFSDGYPLLVASVASLDELNRRLGAAGHAPVTLARFRPNLVLDGLDAHGEDHVDTLRFDTPDGPVVLRLVKPCPRCPIPDVDPDTAATGTCVTDTLATYRADARVDGALTFGMNAVIVEGFDRVLRAGQAGGASWKFD
jgi:uncharacterized protein YcbX